LFARNLFRIVARLSSCFGLVNPKNLFEKIFRVALLFICSFLTDDFQGSIGNQPSFRVDNGEGGI
ncbi:MAG: hypothetical protein IKL78_04635, partial [Lachnospiraceae bacterium]|nr:hypothetical protein [Lachnospiraceae bacterium]